MVTWLVHMRAPYRLAQDLGWTRLVAINVMLLDGFAAFLLQPFFLFATASWVLTGSAPWESNLGAILSLWIGTAFLLGQLFILSAAFVAVKRRFGVRRALWTPLLWLYWQLGTIAGLIALKEMFTDRSGWAKTEHGTSASAQAKRNDALKLD